MPFQVGGIALHDDVQHAGSAKRGTASGVASLDALSRVPASELALAELLARKNAVSGYAGLDAGSKVAVANLPVNTASGIAGLDAGSKVAVANLPVNTASGIAGLDAGSKVAVANLPVNTANGIAGLDASSKYAGLTSTTKAGILNVGTYTGNGATNRAIAHGLGVVPSFVIIADNQATKNVYSILGYTPTELFRIGGSTQTVTSMDSTNFYVGAYGNDNTWVFSWFAVGSI